MNKNSGCQDCKIDCKDKSKNGYFYCPDFVRKNVNNNNFEDYDIPEGFLPDEFGDIFGFGKGR